MKNIGIVYLATSVYTVYFNNFISTAQNIFPEDHKTVIFISDKGDELDNTTINGMDIHVKHIDDLPFPLIPLLKLNYVVNALKDYNFDYILYFDADTILFDMSIELANNLKSIMDDGKLIISRHPNYLYHPDLYYNEEFIVKNPNSSAYVEDDIINDNKTYLISSFFGGTYDVLQKYNKIIYNMIGKDLSNIRSIPQFFDEAYFNKINVEENLRNHQDTIYVDNFITVTPYYFGDEFNRSSNYIWENNFPEYKNIFINQKYDTDIKNSKKNNE